MLSVYERINCILLSYSPSEAIFKVKNSFDGQIYLEREVVKKSTIKELPEDKELQNLLLKEVVEMWDSEDGMFYHNKSVEDSWSSIKTRIIKEYERISNRSHATKRKTEKFIRDIEIDSKFLPNFLIQTFIKINSDEWPNLPIGQREATLENFESLRRTYGKRS